MSWILLVGGIFVIVLAGLGLTYSQQTGQQDRLNQELAQAQLILNKSSSDGLASEKEDLEGRLVQAASWLKTLKTSLSPVVESIESSDSLFYIAETCDVEIVKISSSAPSVQEIDGVKYSALGLRVKLEGEVPDILRFIHSWTEQFPTGEVKSVRVDVPGITDEEEEEAGEGEGDEELGETGEEDEAQGDEEEGEAGEEDADEELQKPSADVLLIIYTYRGD